MPDGFFAQPASLAGYTVEWAWVHSSVSCLHQCTGCPKKHDPHSFCLVSLATNMLESWDIIHWKGGIHIFVWSTKTFLYNIWEPRYKQIKMEYQISKCFNIGKSTVWKLDTATIYA